MKQLQITSMKQFMNHLLVADTFEPFLLEEAVIGTACTYRIDGHVNQEFYSGDEDDSQDPMLKTAVEVVIDAGQASTSLLQRRCKLGYARAARIMDEMEQLHIIGPYEGSKPRQVLITRQQWIEMTMQQASDSTPEV